MKKILKKITLFLLILVLTTFSITIKGFTASTSIKKITEVSVETLQEGVVFEERTINSAWYSNSAQDRTVFSYTIPFESQSVKLATWTYSNPYGYENRNLMDIAKDYEKNHPGSIVLGGVNAEGYTASASWGYSRNEPTNAIVQDGDVLRKDISAEEFKEMICLNKDKTFSIKRIPEVSDKPYLYIFDDKGNIVNHIEITGKNSLSETGLCLLTRDYSGAFDFSGYKIVKGIADLYRITTAFPGGTMTGDNWGIYVKGKIEKNVEDITKIVNGEFYLLTKDESIYNLLTIGANIKVQFDYLDDFGKVESAIGYMFKYVEDGVVCDDNYKVYLEEEGRYAARYGSHDYYKSIYKERCGIGFKDNGDIVLMTANTGTGGPCQYEMGEYFKKMGCNYAYQFDGGGSVTFIKRNESGGFDMLNNPADGSPRSIMTGLFVVLEVPDIRVEATEIGSNYVKLSRDIVKDGGRDVSNIIIKIGSKYYPFNGDIVVNDLESFKTYNYELIDARYDSLNITGSFQTIKKDIEINKLKIELINGEYVYTLDYVDSDNALNKIMISADNLSLKTFKDGVAILPGGINGLNNIIIKAVLRQDGVNNNDKEYSGYKVEYGFNEATSSLVNEIQNLVNSLIESK